MTWRLPFSRRPSGIRTNWERVQVAGPNNEPKTAWVIASNVYLKTAQGWRMILHHASPGSASDVQELSEGPATLH